MSTAIEVTKLLDHLSQGDEDSRDRLMELVYDELRKIAAGYLRAERSDHTLQPTALANEAYLKLVGQREVVWQSRAHFFGIAAQAMRRILVDHARRRNAARRGGGQRDLTLLEDVAGQSKDPIDVIALDGALTEFATVDPRGARIVEIRWFSGLSIQETAEVMGVSEVTVKRDWRYAKAWLYRRLSGGAEPPSS